MPAFFVSQKFLSTPAPVKRENGFRDAILVLLLHLLYMDFFHRSNVFKAEYFIAAYFYHMLKIASFYID